MSFTNHIHIHICTSENLFTTLWFSQKLRKSITEWRITRKIYNSVQMFQPIRDRNPHFVGKMSVSWFFNKVFQNSIGSSVLWPNYSQKELGGKIQIFVEVIFFASEFLFLGLTWRTMLLYGCTLKILRYFLCVCIYWWKIWNCSIYCFWSMWSFSFKVFWRLTVTVCTLLH